MRIAALDIGSNSFHLIVAQVRPGGRIEILDRAKEMVRLGEATLRTGIIPPENTNWLMTATTSSGMICSLDFAKAESARGTPFETSGGPTLMDAS